MFPTREVISLHAAAHRLNNGFIKRILTLDEKHKNKTVIANAYNLPRENQKLKNQKRLRYGGYY